MNDHNEAEELDPGSAFLIEAFDPANRENPYDLYARARTEHPVLSSGTGLSFTFTHGAAHSLLRSRTTSSDERKSAEFMANVDTDPALQRYAAMEPLMLFTDPPDHTRLRSLVSRAFTPRTVERMRPRLEELATELLDTIDGAGPVDFVERVGYRFPVTVICELLGVPGEDVAVFQGLSDDLTLSIEPGALRSDEQQAAIDRARDELADYISSLLEHRRKNPGEDLISGLLAARDGDDRLSEVELINMVVLLLLAGHETTVNLISNGVVALLRNPDQLAVWRDNPAIAPNAVDELIRYDSPVQMAMRVILEPTEIEGIVLPEREQLICLLGAANHDPAVFDDPTRLDLTRHNAGANLSFGGGIHHCLGIALARTEGVVLLDALIRRFDTLELVAEPELRERFVLRGYEKVHLQAS